MEALTALRWRWLALLFGLLPLLDSPALRSADEWLADRTPQLADAKAHDQLVLIDIDESSVQALGPWPWSRARTAQLMQELRRLGAAQQVWDFFFPEPRPGDEVLRAALDADIVIGVVPVLDPRVQSPPMQGELGDHSACQPNDPVAHGHIGLSPSLADSRVRIGHLAPQFDPDGRLRRVPAFACVQGRRIPALALAALPQAPWAVEANGTVRIPMRLDTHAIQAWPAAWVLSGQLPSGILQGKTVLVGATALGAGDRVVTALGPNTPGVLIHAQLLDAGLSDAMWVRPTWAPWAQTAVALVALGLTVLALRLGLLFAWGIALLAALLGWAAHAVLLTHAGLWLGPAHPLLACALGALALSALRGWELRQSRAHLAKRLSGLLPPELAQRLVSQVDASQYLPPERHPYTVLAIQLRNIDRYSEAAPTEQVLGVAQAMATLLEPLVSRYNAQLYPSAFGQWLLAWRGALGLHAGQAVACATACHQTLSQSLQKLPHPPEQPALAVAIGVAHDHAFSGFLGQHRQWQPFLQGPAVQHAQALANLAADLASPVLIEAQVQTLAQRSDTVNLGIYLPPGYRAPVNLCALRGVIDPLPTP